MELETRILITRTHDHVPRWDATGDRDGRKASGGGKHDRARVAAGTLPVFWNTLRASQPWAWVKLASPRGFFPQTPSIVVPWFRRARQSPRASWPSTKPLQKPRADQKQL